MYRGQITDLDGYRVIIKMMVMIAVIIIIIRILTPEIKIHY